MSRITTYFALSLLISISCGARQLSFLAEYPTKLDSSEYIFDGKVIGIVPIYERDSIALIDCSPEEQEAYHTVAYQKRYDYILHGLLVEVEKIIWPTNSDLDTIIALPFSRGGTYSRLDTTFCMGKSYTILASERSYWNGRPKNLNSYEEMWRTYKYRAGIKWDHPIKQKALLHPLLFGMVETEELSVWRAHLEIREDLLAMNSITSFMMWTPILTNLVKYFRPDEIDAIVYQHESRVFYRFMLKIKTRQIRFFYRTKHRINWIVRST